MASLFKTTFIQSRLNSDNFWNLMFALGMSVGMILSKYSMIIAFFTIILVPSFIKIAQDVNFVEKYGFFDKNGRSLKDSKPRYIKLTIFIASLIALMISFTSINNAPLIWSILFFIPTLYFILNNCPISVLFNKQSFSNFMAHGKPNVMNRHTSNNINRHISIPSSDYITKPQYSYMPCNIYYKR